jgi:hypothetical protein
VLVLFVCTVIRCPAVFCRSLRPEESRGGKAKSSPSARQSHSQVTTAWNMDPSFVPKLPGYNTDDPTARKTTHQKTLKYKSGFSYVQPFEDDSTSRVAAVRAMTNKDGLPAATGMLIPGEDKAGESSFTPSYVALDGKVLKFDAYMKEDVPEIPAEGYRIRVFTICYFLVDDSIRISEVKQENSGIAQGTFLKRHRVPKPGAPGEYMGWEDLRIGSTLTLYGRSIRITDCDQFTRNFFESKGVPQGAKLDTPVDPYFTRRKAAEEKVIVAFD